MRIVLMVLALAGLAALLWYGLWSMDRIIRVRRRQLAGAT